MTARAERVYLSFFEGDGDNGPRLARAIRQVIREARKESMAYLVNELYAIADELEDPNLLYGIYGNCCD